VTGDRTEPLVRSSRTCKSAFGRARFGKVVKKIDPRKIRDCAARITRTRLALGFKTQTAFAKEIGIHPYLYNPFERGKWRVSLAVAFKIRNKFGIPLDWIYCGDASRLPAALSTSLKERK
jgi:DNA-binding XRE family transcriptional regulator